MSQRPLQHTGLKIPRQLQQELGLDLSNGNGKKRRSDGEVSVRRRERRRADRTERRTGRSTANVSRTNRLERRITTVHDSSQEEEESRIEQEQEVIARSTSRKEPRRLQPQTSKTPEPKLKSILKPRKPSVNPATSSDDPGHKRSPSPGLVLDRASRSFRDRAAQDDADIAALEKKLGIKTKKLPKSFDNDGLGDLLQGIDSGDENRKRKSDGQQWLEKKRRRMVDDEDDDSNHQSEALEGDEEVQSDLEDEDLLHGTSEASGSEEQRFDGLSSSDEEPAGKPTPRKRENPYVAPVSDTAQPRAKYIPPSLRKETGSESESLQHLRRQVQGQLNKLSEAKLLVILVEIEKFYQTNARQDVTSTLIDLLLSLFCDASVLQNTFVILHASFVAAVYKVVGTDFGADFVSQLVQRFESLHKPQDIGSGKQSVNLISLMAHLYTFHVIGSNLVYDHIRILLEVPSETNAELLLRIVRDAGPQLRQDDPSSLKDIVLLMQKSAAKSQAEGATISVRTKFMIETITDLKNNKLKTEIASNGMASEHITHMRKMVGTLNSRNIRASEPLRFGLADVKNADKRGKWWLVGSSWKEHIDPGEITSPINDHGNGVGEIVDGEEADLIVLARQHRMNTAVRRAIFIAIMSAHDYQDAHLRLRKLRLKRSQEQEIPRVLMHCAAAEEKYNPYYYLIAKTLCQDRRLRMALQFSLWDFFRRLGERADDLDDDDEDDGEDVQLKEIVNTARMFGNLIADGTMSLGVLKALSLPVLKHQAIMFVEILLIVVICKSQERTKGTRDEDSLAQIFVKCRDTPQVVGGLRHFLKKVVRHTDLASSKVEERLVKWGCKVAIDTLTVVSSAPNFLA